MILIIDDDSAIRSSLSFMLKRAKYEVQAVAGPREAIEIVRSVAPQLILMGLSKQQPNTSIYILMQCPIAAYIPEISRIFLWRAAISVLPMWHWALSA